MNYPPFKKMVVSPSETHARLCPELASSAQIRLFCPTGQLYLRAWAPFCPSVELLRPLKTQGVSTTLASHFNGLFANIFLEMRQTDTSCFVVFLHLCLHISQRIRMITQKIRLCNDAEFQHPLGTFSTCASSSQKTAVGNRESFPRIQIVSMSVVLVAGTRLTGIPRTISRKPKALG